MLRLLDPAIVRKHPRCSSQLLVRSTVCASWSICDCCTWYRCLCKIVLFTFKPDCSILIVLVLLCELSWLPSLLIYGVILLLYGVQHARYTSVADSTEDIYSLTNTFRHPINRIGELCANSIANNNACTSCPVRMQRPPCGESEDVHRFNGPGSTTRIDAFKWYFYTHENNKYVYSLCTL